MVANLEIDKSNGWFRMYPNLSSPKQLSVSMGPVATHPPCLAINEG